MKKKTFQQNECVNNLSNVSIKFLNSDVLYVQIEKKVMQYFQMIPK